MNKQEYLKGYIRGIQLTKQAVNIPPTLLGLVGGSAIGGTLGLLNSSKKNRISNTLSGILLGGVGGGLLGIGAGKLSPVVDSATNTAHNVEKTTSDIAETARTTRYVVNATLPGIAKNLERATGSVADAAKGLKAVPDAMVDEASTWLNTKTDSLIKAIDNKDIRSILPRRRRTN